MFIFYPVSLLNINESVLFFKYLLNYYLLDLMMINYNGFCYESCVYQFILLSSVCINGVSYFYVINNFVFISKFEYEVFNDLLINLFEILILVPNIEEYYLSCFIGFNSDLVLNWDVLVCFYEVSVLYMYMVNFYNFMYYYNGSNYQIFNLLLVCSNEDINIKYWLSNELLFVDLFKFNTIWWEIMFNNIKYNCDNLCLYILGNVQKFNS